MTVQTHPTSSDGDGGEKCEDGGHVNASHLGSSLRTVSCVSFGGICYSRVTEETCEAQGDNKPAGQRG